MRFWLKQCPRCWGDLRADADRYGSYIACMQCGYILNQTEETRLIAIGTLREPEPVAAGASRQARRA